MVWEQVACGLQQGGWVGSSIIQRPKSPALTHVLTIARRIILIKAKLGEEGSPTLIFQAILPGVTEIYPLMKHAEEAGFVKAPFSFVFWLVTTCCSAAQTHD